MNNYNHLSMKEILYFSPFDEPHNLEDKGLDSTNFWQDFFVELDIYKNYYDEVKKALTSLEQERTFIILSGYSGIGKTTFLYWFQKKIKKENSIFKIINIINEPKVDKGGENLLIQTIKEELLHLLKKPTSIEKICIHLDDYFRKYFMDFVNKEKGLRVYHKLLKFRDDIQKGIVSNATIEKFLETLQLKHLLILYFMENITRFITQGVDQTSYSFCFDNLDGLGPRYLTSEIWKDFSNIGNILSDVCRLEFCKFPLHKLKILLVFREATLGIYSPQAYDNFRHKIYKMRRLILKKESKKIFSKRYKIITNHKKYEDNKQLFDLVKIINKELYIEEYLIPLFNFDHRSFFHVIEELANIPPRHYTDKPYINLKYEEYKEIKEISRYGARGILINALVGYFMDRRFFEKFLEEKRENEIKIYRPSRLILTVLNNLSYPKGLPDDNDQLLRIEPVEFTIEEAISVIKNLINEEEVLKWLSEFFSPEKGSWAHFINIYGLEISFDEFKSLKKIEKIRKAKILFNASAYLYLRIIITHFEYFSIVESEKFNKALFQSTSYNFSESKFEFEYIIEYVLKVVNECRNRSNLFLQDIVFKKVNWTLDDYLSSEFIFNRAKKNLFISRMITTHIEYLDQFRKYLWYSKSFNNYIKKFPHVKSMKNSIEIQKYIINKINEYIKILKNGILEDSIIKKTIPEFEKKINLLDSSYFEHLSHNLSNSNEWISIESKPI